jgi:hypothetical protein
VAKAHWHVGYSGNPQLHCERPWSNATGMTRTFSAQGANAAAAIALFEGAQDSEGGQHEA